MKRFDYDSSRESAEDIFPVLERSRIKSFREFRPFRTSFNLRECRGFDETVNEGSEERCVRMVDLGTVLEIKVVTSNLATLVLMSTDVCESRTSRASGGRAPVERS